MLRSSVDRRTTWFLSACWLFSNGKNKLRRQQPLEGKRRKKKKKKTFSPQRRCEEIFGRSSKAIRLKNNFWKSRFCWHNKSFTTNMFMPFFFMIRLTPRPILYSLHFSHSKTEVETFIFFITQALLPHRVHALLLPLLLPLACQPAFVSTPRQVLTVAAAFAGYAVVGVYRNHAEVRNGCDCVFKWF